MLFYKIEGILTTVAENEDSRRAHRENVRKIAVKSEEFNNKCRRNSFCFVSACSDGIVTIGVIADQFENIDVTIKAFMKHIGYELKDVVTTEITINGI